MGGDNSSWHGHVQKSYTVHSRNVQLHCWMSQFSCATVFQKLDFRDLIKHFKSHNAAVLEKRNNRLSLTYDRQKHIGNAHVDIVTIYNLQFMRNLMESLENEAPLEPTCFAWNLKTAR